MPTRAFIIHGYLSYPQEAWLPWLKVELEKRGCQVALPAMPQPDHPVIEEWLAFITALVGEPDAMTLLIGHSMGCHAVLRYLERVGAAGKAVGKTLLVAGTLPVERPVAEVEKMTEGHPALTPWFSRGVDAALVKRAAGECTVILADNDPYIDVAEARTTFQAALAPKIVILPEGGHFNEDDGLTELPAALAALYPAGV